MVRVRLASLALAGSLALLSGCCAYQNFLARLRPCQPGCECEEVAIAAPGCATGACPGGPLITNAHPPIVEGPSLFPGSPAPVFPGATMPPAMGATTRPAPLPPVVSAPQATPIPAGP